MSNYVIGLDFGSDSVRALLVEAETGAELAGAVAAYPRWARGLYCDPGRNQFRQHPLDYLECLEQAVTAALADVSPEVRAGVVGIGIDTTGSTPCAVDAEGRPLALRPEFAEDPDAMFILWKDHTALAEADAINQRARNWGGIDYTKYEGGIYSSEWFWSKILHILRTNEAVRRAAVSWVEHCDWMGAELVGETRPERLRRSRCAAGHKAMWHASWGGLPAEEFLSGIDPLLSGLRARLYDSTYTAEVPLGTLSEKWAKKLGLSTRVVVSGGAFDCHMGAVGAGIAPYSLVKVIGTSTCDVLVAPELPGCVRGICGQVDGSVVPGLVGLEAGQSAFGDIYAHFKQLLSWPLEHFAVAEKEAILKRLLPQLEEAAAQVAPGSNRLLALDWHNGRRTPDANQKLTGALFGLSLGSTAPMIFRALVESTAYGARRIVERFESEGVPVREVVAIGGIAVKSPFVMQICADVLNRPIKVARSGQCCALGAAIFAAVAAGLYPDVPEAMKKMSSPYAGIYEPDAEQAKIYDRLYRRYGRYATAVEQLIMSEEEE